MGQRDRPFGWFGIVRLGFIQMALGAIVILTTSTLNRVMVVELALPASLPGLLVGWHYAVQISRPRWGFSADQGGRRGVWIVGGQAVLAAGAVLAAASAWLMATHLVAGLILSFLAFSLIGGGVGAAGTNLLALLAVKTPPDRKAAAAAIVWIMMIVGFIISSAVASVYLDPFTMGRLVGLTAVIGLVAVIISALSLLGLRTKPVRKPSVSIPENVDRRAPGTSSFAAFRGALAAVWQDPQTRLFTTFIFVSMLAYSAQDLILEPFAGLLHGYTPSESTRLATMQNMGVLTGMVATAILGTVLGRSRASFMRRLSLSGCILSAVGLGFLAYGAFQTTAFSLQHAVFGLGFGNGMFAVAAIGSMMTLASAPGDGREGTRMGVWGAAQAIAFGIGGFLGTAAIDAARLATGDTVFSFALVFGIEALLFIGAGFLGWRVGPVSSDDQAMPFMPAESLPAE
ncbi:MAG: BCD family MFS transporter [Pseudomonadota bacterium]